MREAIVVGAGIVGACVALRLAQRGVTVELVDGRGPATGTSAASFAWINARRRQPGTSDPRHDRAGRDPGRADLAGAYADLKVAAIAEHLALGHELGAAGWLHLGGCLEWSAPGTEAPHTAEPPTDESQSLTRREVALLEPWLELPPGVETVRYFPFEGHVAVPRLVGRVLRELRRLGGRVRTGAEVVELVVDGGTVHGVVLGDGTRLVADAVVSCVGARTDALCGLAGVDLPLAPTQGLLTVTAPSPVRLNTVLSGPEVHLRDDGDGRVLIGAYDLEATIPVGMSSSRPLPEEASVAYARASALLPALRDVGVEAVRIAPRAIPRDGYPVVGTLRATPGLYVICTHGGVGLGPLLARLAARELTGGAADARLAPFAADRLATTSTTATAATTTSDPNPTNTLTEERT